MRKTKAEKIYEDAMVRALRQVVATNVQRMADVMAECERRTREAETRQQDAEHRLLVVSGLGAWEALVRFRKEDPEMARRFIKDAFGINLEELARFYPRTGP